VEEELKEIWPNFFIVGAPRAGTTSLYEYLKGVPGVYMSPVKEPHYFSTFAPVGPFAPPPIRTKEKYLRLFQRAGKETAIGEASATYLADPDTPNRIKEVATDARIIMILRDPVERAYSHYLLHVREGWQAMPVEEAMRNDFYLNPGSYCKQVVRYLNAFGAAKLKILIFEEFIQNTGEGVREVLLFLGLNEELPTNIGDVFNAFASPRWSWARLVVASNLARRTARVLIPAALRRRVKSQILQKRTGKPPMPEETRKFLEELYHEDVLRLEKILGRSLPWFHRRNPPRQEMNLQFK